MHWLPLKIYILKRFLIDHPELFALITVFFIFKSSVQLFFKYISVFFL